MSIDVKPQNLYEYIDLMKIRTAMYIGEHSITVMASHIEGYMIACWFKGIVEDLTPKFGDFNNFVADYYLYSESTAGWKKIILAENYGNEERALDKFFELFDLFRENKPKTNSKKILFSLVNELIICQNTLTKIDEKDFFELLDNFTNLPLRLEEIKYKFQYDELLEEIEVYSKQNGLLKKILAEIREI